MERRADEENKPHRNHEEWAKTHRERDAVTICSARSLPRRPGTPLSLREAEYFGLPYVSARVGFCIS